MEGLVETLYVAPCRSDQGPLSSDCCRWVLPGLCTLTVVNRQFDKGTSAGVSCGCRGHCCHEAAPTSRATSLLGPGRTQRMCRRALRHECQQTQFLFGAIMLVTEVAMLLCCNAACLMFCEFQILLPFLRSLHF